MPERLTAEDARDIHDKLSWRVCEGLQDMWAADHYPGYPEVRAMIARVLRDSPELRAAWAERDALRAQEVELRRSLSFVLASEAYDWDERVMTRREIRDEARALLAARLDVAAGGETA